MVEYGERPKKVDKNRKEILFFLDSGPFICGFCVEHTSGCQFTAVRKIPRTTFC